MTHYTQYLTVQAQEEDHEEEEHSPEGRDRQQRQSLWVGYKGQTRTCRKHMTALVCCNLKTRDLKSCNTEVSLKMTSEPLSKDTGCEWFSQKLIFNSSDCFN